MRPHVRRLRTARSCLCSQRRPRVRCHLIRCQTTCAAFCAILGGKGDSCCCWVWLKTVEPILEMCRFLSVVTHAGLGQV